MRDLKLWLTRAGMRSVRFFGPWANINSADTDDPEPIARSQWFARTAANVFAKSEVQTGSAGNCDKNVFLQASHLKTNRGIFLGY